MIKRILLALLLTLTPTCARETSLQHQEKDCNKVLWYEQKQFGYEDWLVHLYVKRAKDMPPAVWGITRFDTKDHLIEMDILAQEDYQSGMSDKEKQYQQREVVVHEFLHLVMEKVGVPEKAQDEIIEAVRPGVKLP